MWKWEEIQELLWEKSVISIVLEIYISFLRYIFLKNHKKLKSGICTQNVYEKFNLFPKNATKKT